MSDFSCGIFCGAIVTLVIVISFLVAAERL